jgi:hypothetical protein
MPAGRPRSQVPKPAKDRKIVGAHVWLTSSDWEEICRKLRFVRADLIWQNCQGSPILTSVIMCSAQQINQ